MMKNATPVTVIAVFVQRRLRFVAGGSARCRAPAGLQCLGAGAGRHLALLACTTRPTPGLDYASLRKGQLTWPPSSELARDDGACAALWRSSLALCEAAAQHRQAAE